MDNNIDIYFENQDESSKLIYTIGLLWGKISSNLDEILQTKNLNISKFNILMIIKHAGGYDGIQQNEISKRLLVTASNITKLLDKLEKDGLITRNSKKDDRRVKLIRITDYGSNLLDTVWPEYKQAIEKLMSKFPPEKNNEIEKILLEWLTNIN